MRRELFFAFSTIFFLSFGVTQLQADDGFIFKRQTLKVGGDIIGKMYEDLDSNSLSDLLVFYLQVEEENSKRMVGFFRHQKELGFDTIPDQVFELDKKASVVGLADIDKDDKKELLFLAEDGVHYYSLEGMLFNPKPYLLFSTSTFLFAPEENLLIWDFCPDLENGRKMVIIPQKSGYDLWAEKDPKEFVHTAKLEFKPDFSLSSKSEKWDQNRGSIRFSYGMPGVILTDYDNNGKGDILLLEKDGIAVFLSREDGIFQEKPDKEVAFKSRGKEEEQDFQIEDINGDGTIDLVLNEYKQDLEKGSKSKISIYMGKEAEGLRLDSPHQIISSEKEVSSVWFHDLDKEGKKEMIMTSWGFSITSMVKILLSKSAKFNLSIRSLGENDAYPNQPNRELKLSIKVSFGSSGQDNQALDFSGDFNGDGLNDLFYAGGDNILKFFLGRKGDFFGDKPQHEMGIEIPVGGNKIIDLNNDKKSDIVFSFGKEKKELKSKIVVLFSNM